MFGWTDVVLLERDVLTSGSSWHAPGQIHTISSDPNISRLQSYTINLYKEIKETSRHSVGLHSTGGFYLASTPEWYDYLKRERSFDYVVAEVNTVRAAVGGVEVADFAKHAFKGEDLSAKAMRVRDIRGSVVGDGPVILLRLSFSGELGYEIYFRPQYLPRLSEAIEAAGEPLGLTWYEARTLMSLRLEKSRGAWTLDFRPDFTASESGLEAFIDWDKDFIGKAAAEKQRLEGPRKNLVTMVIGVDGIDVSNDEAILHDGEAVGYVSSGGRMRA